jgi:hypothetical protein
VTVTRKDGTSCIRKVLLISIPVSIIYRQISETPRRRVSGGQNDKIGARSPGFDGLPPELSRTSSHFPPDYGQPPGSASPIDGRFTSPSTEATDPANHGQVGIIV